MIFRLASAFVARFLFSVFVLPGVVAGELGTGLAASCFGARGSRTFAGGANLGRTESDLFVVETDLVYTYNAI